MHVPHSEPLSDIMSAPTGWYSWYVASILAIAAALSYMDRQSHQLAGRNHSRQILRLADFQFRC